MYIILIVLYLIFLLASDSESSRDVLQQSMSTSMDTSHDDDEREAPSVVVYLVEPFAMGSDQPELQRLACLALLRCYQSVLASLPENIRSNVSVQVSWVFCFMFLFLTLCKKFH